MQDGTEWPVFNVLIEAVSNDISGRWELSLEALANIKTTSRANRWIEFETLFIGKTEPLVWLYESRHLNGRMPGPATFQLKRLYADVGLETIGAELPDHASMEFAFLAYMSEQAKISKEAEFIWGKAINTFIKTHAGKWLPSVARQLIQLGDPSWKAIGHLVLAALEYRKPKKIKFSNTQHKLPTINQKNSCTLCGFCVQTCPTQALLIQETDELTQLTLRSKLCTGCNKCEQVCFTGALQMEEAKNLEDSQILFTSERAICPLCEEPTVSRAELAFTAEQLGNLDWLEYCLDCRTNRL